jgi:hypothetical protein
MEECGGAEGGVEGVARAGREAIEAVSVFFRGRERRKGRWGIRRSCRVSLCAKGRLLLVLVDGSVDFWRRKRACSSENR